MFLLASSLVCMALASGHDETALQQLCLTVYSLTPLNLTSTFQTLTVLELGYHKLK